MQFLYFIQQTLIWLLTIYWIYQIIISTYALVKFKDKPLLENKNNKFLAIIPAYNEQNVIANLIDSLMKQDYPKEYYDVYVIADNCTDKTEEIAKAHGANVYVRTETDPAKKNKGAALNKFLGHILSSKKMDYDAFCVFDADNIVDEHFFTAMNKHLNQGEDVVQGYRDIKNPDDSWIAAGYAIFYWTMNKFYHFARYNAGLSPLINGTGFMVKMDVIKDTGWKTKTLTEDIEFSLKRIISGNKLGWATDAIVFDEQPVKFKPSWSQRSRWTIGHIQCLKEYTKPLADSAIEKHTLMNFDGLLYMLCSIPMFIITIFLLLINAVFYLNKGMTTQAFALNILRYIVPTFLLPILTGLAVMWIDHKPIKKMLKGLLSYPLFLGSWLVINFKCLFKRDTKWEKIEHTRAVKIETVENKNSKKAVK
jgi:cellulose synthase/poly-beta-1,6-N-acetylglucosamine synthase-like glycosyltransferase